MRFPFSGTIFEAAFVSSNPQDVSKLLSKFSKLSALAYTFCRVYELFMTRGMTQSLLIASCFRLLGP